MAARAAGPEIEAADEAEEQEQPGYQTTATTIMLMLLMMKVNVFLSKVEPKQQSRQHQQQPLGWRQQKRQQQPSVQVEASDQRRQQQPFTEVHVD